MKPSTDSLEELAASTETQVLLRHDTSIGEQMLVRKKGSYLRLPRVRTGFNIGVVDSKQRQVFLRFLRKNARLIPGNIVGDAVKEKLETSRYAFPFVKTFAMSFVSSQFEKDQQCRFKMSKKLPLSTGYYFWLFKKCRLLQLRDGPNQFSGLQFVSSNYSQGRTVFRGIHTQSISQNSYSVV